ncbi:MAG: glycosyltransferase [Acetobacteraceae bacterium]|nr:glycosyltransferase [Acetobacteraceae bacterium]
MTDAPPGTVVAPPARAGDDSRGKDLLICLSHLRWDFVFQRPQHLLTRAARTRDVVFVEEPMLSGETTTPRLDLRSTPEGVTVAVPQLPGGLDHDGVIDMQRMLLRELMVMRGASQRRTTGWFYTPMALEFARDLPFDLVVYDCMDELSLFRGAPPRLVELERDLLARADLVFTGGRSLYEAKRGRHHAVHCFPSSIDTAHFGAARRPQPGEPDGQADLPRPRIGFFGVIDERMDLALVDALAAARPEWSFIMIGPVVKIDPAALPRRPNIHWLGGRRYEELPRHLGAWDAGFMPFALNESTRFISPTKTPEFLAAGLPVVSTPVTDVVRDWGPQGAGLVAIARDAAGFAQAIETMLAEPDRAAWRARVDRVLAEQSWDLTWNAMAALMEDALAGTIEIRPPARRAATTPAMLRSAP